MISADAGNGETTLLSSIEVTAAYTYDPLGRRISKTVNGEQTQFYWLGNTLLRESGPQGQKDYTYGATGYAPVTVDADGQISDVLSDHLSAPIGLIQAQNLIWQQARSPFGKTGGTAQPVTFNIGFPGQYRDAESGLNYNFYRDYDPNTGRYIQRDPIGLRGGLNIYAYVGGNPTNYIDPYGRSAIAVVGGWIGTDTAIPDPTDAAWPKWVGYGVALGGAALIDWLIYNNEDSSQNEKKPKSCPSGTQDIDKAKKKYGWDKDTLHGIKDAAHGGMGTGKSWTGVAPDGTVGINEGGEWSPQGHWEDLL
ncbi:RHS repeat-associated core domain-containing protein [Photobacterium sp. SP02]|uniref:RHS repeat-associated core domain-containing protein n=1 Tax=Photobacterium sp. SP02 TaxID=3032280 RepID=UPI003144D672